MRTRWETATDRTREGARVRFGAAEWLGLAALALTPASGFTWWGWQMSQRMTVVEVRLEAVTRSLADGLGKLDEVVRQDERIKGLERRVESMERTGH